MDGPFAVRERARLKLLKQLCSGQIHGAPRTRSGSFDNFLREKVRTERKARCAAPALCCGSAGPNRLDLCSERAGSGGSPGAQLPSAAAAADLRLTVTEAALSPIQTQLDLNL
ncbi:hypothetical protein FQA47_022521 [Oryzias melastigma]|uniref:Uncharacterized protein n=1 Tax=Oryzias melastigma TaxID=30732 RepID=A0A834CIT9_ORYME|nr:hypothetical protein FQA47_022521 [Oryzias melastigma]